MTTCIPGSSVSHPVITDRQRIDLNDYGAFSAAVQQLKTRYLAVAQGWPVGSGAAIHIVMTVEPDAAEVPAGAINGAA